MTRRIGTAALWRAFPLVLLSAAGACGDVPADTRPVGQDVSGTAHGTPVDSGVTVAPATSREIADSAFLAVEGDGLRVFLASTGSARPLPFGTSAADALALLNATLGAAPTEQGRNVDCAAEYATWENGLTVWFAGDRFVGWSLGRGSALTTVDGIGLGATRSELQAAYEITITPSSLGEEFSVGGLAGLLDSSAPDARVQHLWAGQTCIAR